jgi:hypothetical protein
VCGESRTHGSEGAGRAVRLTRLPSGSVNRTGNIDGVRDVSRFRQVSLGSLDLRDRDNGVLLCGGDGASADDTEGQGEGGGDPFHFLTVTGRTPRYFRFPGGCGHLGDVLLVRRLGLTTVEWDVISGDAGQPDPAVIVRKVLREAQNGSSIVMYSHGGKAPATALALPAIIAGLKARGFVLVTVQALLAGP